MKGMTSEQLFERFAQYAGYMGEIHTPDGPQPMYKIETMTGPIYATDTGILRRAYFNSFYLAPDCRYYHTKSSYEKSKSDG